MKNHRRPDRSGAAFMETSMKGGFENLSVEDEPLDFSATLEKTMVFPVGFPRLRSKR